MSLRARAILLVVLSSVCLALASTWTTSLGAAQDGRVSIFLWHAYGESEARGLEAAVDAFEANEARAGRDVHVEVTAIPFGAYASKLQAAIPVGNGPDVFVDAHDRVASYVEEHLVRGYGPLEPEQAADFEPTQLESLVYGSDLWGVPLSAKGLVL